MIFPELLRRAADHHREREAVRCTQQALTFGQLYERSCRLARALAGAGLRPGDRVASLGRNRLESVEEITGVALGGFVRSPLYTQNTPEVHAYMMGRVEARGLIVDAELWADLRPALLAADVRPRVVLVRGGTDVPDVTEDGVVRRYEDALAESDAVDPEVRTEIGRAHV